MSLTARLKSDPAWILLAKLIASLLGAGIAYSIWLATLLWSAGEDRSVVSGYFWILAPITTAAVFAIGIAGIEQLLKSGKSRFINIFTWSFFGCSIGAAAVYWFGPMLIVFGMFAAGTVTIALREIIQMGKLARLQRDTKRNGH
jgi:hypothetical protein